jgi:hypothetical protein
MIMIACHMIIATLAIGLFVCTLKIKSNPKIPKPSFSSSRSVDFPDDFDFWN